MCFNTENIGFSKLSLFDFSDVLNRTILLNLSSHTKKGHVTDLVWNHRPKIEPKTPFKMKPWDGQDALGQMGA
jgi:hypothetical protein